MALVRRYFPSRASSDLWVSKRRSELAESERTRWRGQWASGTQYKRSDQVLDGNYLMIANKDTEDKAAPEPIGEPRWMREIPGTPPAWTNENATENAIYVGQRLTFPSAYFASQFSIYIPGGNIGNKASGWVVIDPLGLPNYTQVIPEFVVEAEDDDAWINFPIGKALMRPGETIDIVLVIRVQSGLNVWQATWSAKRSNGAPSEGEAWHQSGSGGTRFHHTDKDDIDRTAQLQALSAGDEYEVAGVSYVIREATQNPSDVHFLHDPASRPQENDLVYSFSSYTAAPIPYVRVPDWYAAEASIKGFFATTYDPGALVLTDDLMGVDLLIADVLLSPDWDFQAFSQ